MTNILELLTRSVEKRMIIIKVFELVIIYKTLIFSFVVLPLLRFPTLVNITARNRDRERKWTIEVTERLATSKKVWSR